MDLKITKTLVIPSNDMKWRFSRSSGPGGQNVNKLESRVEIIFNLEDSKVLNDYQKGRYEGVSKRRSNIEYISDL